MVKWVKNRLLLKRFDENCWQAIYDATYAKQLDISMKGDANWLKSK